MFSAGARAGGVGSTTLPFGSVYADANNAIRIYEAGVFNTTNTAVALALRRLSSAGTATALTTDGPWDDMAMVGSGYDVHSSTGPTLGTLFRQFTLGAAAGSGMVFTFGKGIYIPKGTANGIGFILATGTGQICDWYMDWDLA